MVCVVGQEMTKGVRLWGDVTALTQRGDAARFCPMWAAKLNSPQLVAHYQSTFDPTFLEQTLDDAKQFWSAGRRISCLSQSQDGWSMIAHFGRQTGLPDALRFEQGDVLYIMCFQSLHRQAFEYGALVNGLKKWAADETTDGAQLVPPTLQQLLGQPASNFDNLFQEIGFSDDALSNLDEEQRHVAEALLGAPGCVHALWSAAGARKSHILAVCLMEWANKSEPSALSLFVTSRKRHRGSALHALRRFMPEGSVWIVEGHSEETPVTEEHLYAQAKEHVANRLNDAFERLQELGQKIDSIGGGLVAPCRAPASTLCVGVVATI